MTITPKFIVTLLVASVLCISGCGHSGVTPSPTPTPPSPTPASQTPSQIAANIEASLPLIRTGASVASGAVLNFAVKQDSTRTRLANEMYSAASSVYTLTGGNLPSPAQFQSNIVVFGGSQADANYAQFSTAIAGLYAAYYPKLVTGDAKTATDVLNAIAGGIEDATKSYVTVPSTATN